MIELEGSGILDDGDPSVPRVKITVKGKSVRRPKDSVDVETPDGYWFIVNEGEWGGTVWFYPKDGGEGYRVHRDTLENATLLELDNKVLGFSGMAQMGIGEGKLVEYRMAADGHWRAHHQTAFPGYPEGFHKRDENAAYVLTASSLLLVTADGEYDVLVEDLRMVGMYPRGLHSDGEGNLYTGMRHIVLKFSELDSRLGPNVSVLVPDDSYPLFEGKCEDLWHCKEPPSAIVSFYRTYFRGPWAWIAPAWVLVLGAFATFAIVRRVRRGRRTEKIKNTGA